MGLVFGAAAALGTLGVISTLAYQEGMPAAVFTALRAALGALILGVLVLARWQPRVSLRSLAARERRMLVIAVLANGSMNLLLFAAFSVMAVAIVMTLFYTYPVMVMVAMAAMGLERITPLRVGALALAMAGLVLVVGSQVGPEANVTLTGVGLALAAAVCQAAYLVVSRDGYASVPAVQATSLILLGGMLISGTAALLTGGFATASDWVTEPVVWLAVLLAGTHRGGHPQGHGAHGRAPHRRHAHGHGHARGARRGRRRGSHRAGPAGDRHGGAGRRRHPPGGCPGAAADPRRCAARERPRAGRCRRLSRVATAIGGTFALDGDVRTTGCDTSPDRVRHPDGSLSAQPRW